MQKINAGIYIRVSTEHQAKEGYSITAQKENLTKFSNNQGWNIFDIYSDEGISGKDIKNRPEVKRLINDIKDNKIDVVVLYKFDRLTRDMSDTEDIIKLIQTFGVEVFTLSGGIVDVSSATGRFAIRINGAVAQLEREQTIERVKVAFEQKVREGYSLCSSTTCYGYDRKKGEKLITIKKEEAKIIKRIFQMYLLNFSLTEIAKTLNLEGIPTKLFGKIRNKKINGIKLPTKIESVWQPKTIRLILSNPTYVGKVRYHINLKDGFVSDGVHEAIIDEKTFLEVQKKLAKIKKISKTNLPKEEVYYCGSLLCGECNHKLTTNRTVRVSKKSGTQKRFNGYRCINREKGICNSIGMSHKKIEEAFINYLDNIEDLTENIDISKLDTKDIEIKRLKKQIYQINKKKKEVMDLFIINKINNKQLLYMTKELDNNYSNIKERLKYLSNNIKKVSKINISKNIKKHWEYLSNRERFNFLTNFVESIVVINKKAKVKILDVKFYE